MAATDIRIAAVVVLYNPGDDVSDNISSYLDQVEVVYAVDNTVSPSPSFAERITAIPRVRYLSNRTNLGVATALNMAAANALADGYHFLLTMDQDSKAAPEMVGNLLRIMAGDPARTGIVSPFHITTASKSPPAAPEYQEVMTPMTSGCLLNLDVYQVVGPFRDDLFIDFVDNEYCLRLRKRGFRVLRVNRALLHHTVGDTRMYGPLVATNHPPLRRYYKTRNRFLVNTLYRDDFPGHCLFDRVRLVKEIGSIILFEREKGAKLRMMWRGYMDYRRGRFGRYEG